MAKLTIEQIDKQMAELQALKKQQIKEQKKKEKEEKKKLKLKNDTIIADLVRKFFGDKSDEEIIEYFNNKLAKKKSEKTE